MIYGPHEHHHLEVLSRHVHAYDVQPYQWASGHSAYQRKEAFNTFYLFHICSLINGIKILIKILIFINFTTALHNLHNINAMVGTPYIFLL